MTKNYGAKPHKELEEGGTTIFWTDDMYCKHGYYVCHKGVRMSNAFGWIVAFFVYSLIGLVLTFLAITVLF